MSIHARIATCASFKKLSRIQSGSVTLLSRARLRPRVPARTIAILVAATIACAGSVAHARSGFQGTQLLQSSLGVNEIQDNWMQGPYLAGFLPDGRPVAITDFAGTAIRAVDLAADGEDPASIDLDPEDLVGLEWSARLCLDNDDRCRVITYRIAGTAADSSVSTMPMQSQNRDVALFELEYTLDDPETGAWQNPCVHPGSSSPMGMFVNGRWSRDGSWTPGGYTFSCLGGVVAKCARDWGYKPWKLALSPTHGAVRLGALHQACVRAARADYCGDGTSHTADGTLVDLVDAYGLNPPEPDRRFTSEAGFDTGGAVWARHPRIVGQSSGSAPACRRDLRGNPDKVPALIEVRSRPDNPAHP